MFNVGDRVRLAQGWTEMEVVDVFSTGNVAAAYGPRVVEGYRQAAANRDVGAAKALNLKTRPASHFVHWDPQDEMRGTAQTHFTEKKEPTTMSTLYSWKDATSGKEVYGLKLAVNGEGLWVMDPKRGGEPVAIPRDKVSKVVPYSIAVNTLLGAGSDYHVWVDPDAGLAVGDYILNATGNVVVVTAVDTKSERAREALTGIKLAGTVLTAPADSE